MDGWTDDGWTDDGPWLDYKLTSEPKGSGEIISSESRKEIGTV